MTLDSLPLWTPGISETVALAAVALIGYLFGRRGGGAEDDSQISADIVRATNIAHQLEGIASGLRSDLAYHRSQVEKFKRQLRSAATDDEPVAWKKLREEAEAVLAPTLDLVGQLSTAYDKIRVQTQALTHYTGSRVDAATGLSNGKALEEQLEVMLGQTGSAISPHCSIAMLSVAAWVEGSEDEGLSTQEVMERLAKAVSGQLRGGDFAARYGIDELVVVMPKTPLSGASVFGCRMRATLEVQLGCQVCCGLAEAAAGESARAFLGRADAALYSARAASPGAQYLHNGSSILADGVGASRDSNASPLPC